MMKSIQFSKVLFFSCLLLFIYSCQKERGDYLGTYSFEILEQGDQSNMTSMTEKSVSKLNKWEEFWEEEMGRTTAPPTIDFDNEAVIVIGIGNKFTDSYKIQVNEIEEYENELEVLYGWTSPGPNQVVDSTETNPYVLLKIEKTDKEITF